MRSLLKVSIGALIAVLLYALAGFTYVIVVNSDVRGRLIETIPVGAKTEEPIIVRVVLHRLLADENAVEVSVVLLVRDDLVYAVKEGRTKLTVIARDRSSYSPWGVAHAVTLDHTAAGLRAGVGEIGVESERFTLPALPSVSGFPFDDVQVNPDVMVFRDDVWTDDVRLEIQKSIPGRLMEISGDRNFDVRLSRTPTEQFVVIGASIVFLFLSAVLGYAMFRAPHGLRTVDELLGVGGYVIAAAGFREILGLSRVSGMTALEVAVIGIPLLVLTFGVAVSFFRARRVAPGS
ncbi:MAG TPA: hypothetical protein VHW00_19655 [Thermoanaerobaculia bacterium]|nr:hypothetical protein [Thermoanaerobaculia bacterium]